MVFMLFPFQCDLKVLDYQENSTNVDLIKHDVASYLGSDQFSLFCNGKSLHDADVISNDSTVQVTFSLPGGKGGFGSMLRAIGAQIEKTTNREACRDLSGRRLRDINEEQRLKKWIMKEAEREAEKVRRRKERIERLKSQAPHKFFDFEYEKEISELPNRINDALSEGLQKAKQPAKRPLEKPEKLPKKTWLGDDLPSSSSDSELEEAGSGSDASPSKKPKLGILGCESISESSQSLPGTLKDSCFVFDESSASTSDSNTDMIEDKSKKSIVTSDGITKDEQTGNKDDEKSNYNVDTDTSSTSDTNVTDSTENTMDTSVKDVASITDAEVSQSLESTVKNNLTGEITVERSAQKDVLNNQTKSADASSKKEPEEKDDSPIDLLNFQSVSEVEALGLDKLKSALMARGLKCGGSLSDRAQRLWKVRSLQPHEYPANLLAKNKK